MMSVIKSSNNVIIANIEKHKSWGFFGLDMGLSRIEEMYKSMDNIDFVIDNDLVRCFKVCDLLKKRTTFYIPDFQRFYIWDKKNIEQLYNDICESIQNKKELFIGNSILKEEGNNIKIIDGQQRIVTLLILLRSIVDTKHVRRDHLEYFKEILENIDIKKGPKLRLLDPTPYFFEKYILKGEKLDNLTEITNQNIDPINRIITAREKLGDKMREKGGMDLILLSNFIIKYIKIVAIFPKILENEIYDSINSKGVPLTEADKIKNFLFKIVNNKKKKKLYKNWYDLLRIFAYSSRRVSSFIELYWTITKEDPKRNLYKRFISFFEKEKLDPVSFSKELLDYAKIYAQILKQNLDKKYWGKGKYGSLIVEIINNLRYLDMKTSYYLIVEMRSSFKSYFEGKGKRKFMEDIVDLFSDIERYSFLHINLFDNYPQELKDFYSVRSIRLKNGKEQRKNIFKNIRKEIKEEINKYLNYNDFNDAITFKCHPPNLFTRNETVYLLYKLLVKFTKTDIFEKNINLITKKSIEHIMPRNPSLWWEGKLKNYIKDWEQYPKRGITERVKKYYEFFLNDLGNLSILTNITNNELGNKSFPEKVKILVEKEKDNRLFDTVIKASEWSQSEIDMRRELFISNLHEIFTIKPLE